MNPVAFLLAGGAILLWSSLALISSRLGHLPAILMTGIALTIGGTMGIVRVKEWRVPVPTFLLGVGGIFGYHVMLFTAFQLSPIVEANLVNYLWPLLIVLLTPAILPGFGLKARHVLGAVMGLAGAALIATGGSIHPDLSALPGYLLAAAAALTWALYSLLTKRVPAFGSGAVGAFCCAAGLLSLALYFAQAGSRGFGVIRGSDWPFLVLLGVGPMGAAFFLWDAALKRGDTRIIGSLSYMTPLLSTLALTLIGGRTMGLLPGIAMGLIVAGAATGSVGSGSGILKKSGVMKDRDELQGAARMTVFTDEQMREGIASTRTYCVVILRSTQRRREPGIEKIIWEHGRRNFGLRADGILPIVCPVNDGTDLSGIGIFTTSVEETKKILDEDPGVKEGVFTYEVHPCRGFPGSSLPR